MERSFKIGLAVKPQGVRGEIKVRPLTDDPERFKLLKEVYIDGEVHKVLGARIGAGEVFISLAGVSDRNAAEAFRGKFLTVPREEAVEPEEGRYFIADLIGAAVITENGEKIGTVASITEGRTDVVWLKGERGESLAFPFLKKVINKVDIENATITVNEERFNEVVCRED